MTDARRWLWFWIAVAAALLIYLLKPILAPFLAGALLAYLGDPVADRLESWRVPRTAAVVIVFVGLTLLVAGVLLLVLPLVGRQIDYLREQLPGVVAWIQSTALPYLGAKLGIGTGQAATDKIRDLLSSSLSSTGDVVAGVLAQASRSGLALFGWLANIALVPVVTFYLLRDWDRLMSRLRDLLPRPVEPTVTRLAKDCDEVLGAFFRGQLLVMICLGAVYALGLWLVGLKLAFLIGLLAGLASVVPYLGFALGLIAATAAGFFQFHDWHHMLLVWAVFLVGQAAEGTVLTPILVGDRIGLHPVAVIFAVLAGGQLFGFSGVLLALPIAAVLASLLRHAGRAYRNSALYGAPSATGDPESTRSDNGPE